MTENKQMKGSRLRSSILSTFEAELIQLSISQIVMDANISDLSISFGDDFRYYPQDDKGIKEHRFSDKNGLVNETLRKKLIKWWLDIDEDTDKQTPNWDFACNCVINGKKGLILVESKAHKGELIKKDPLKARSEQSKNAIRKAITEANRALNESHRGFNLNWETHYQLSNRFAWSWKLASEGIPVVLIYLGFLDCEEMNSNGRIILRTKEDWVSLFQNNVNHVIPFDAWQNPISTGNASFYPILAAWNLHRKTF